MPLHLSRYKSHKEGVLNPFLQKHGYVSLKTYTLAGFEHRSSVLLLMQ
jgi:hypothetical protein